jgi:hypothetical protein
LAATDGRVLGGPVAHLLLRSHCGSSSVDYRRENAKFCKELLSDVENSRYHEAAFDIRPVFCSVGSYCRGPSFVSTGRRESTRPIDMVMSQEGYDSDRLVNNATKGEIEMPKHEGAEHHKKAAEHHDHAARHHRLVITKKARMKRAGITLISRMDII